MLHILVLVSGFLRRSQLEVSTSTSLPPSTRTHTGRDCFLPVLLSIELIGPRYCENRKLCNFYEPSSISKIPNHRRHHLNIIIIIITVSIIIIVIIICHRHDVFMRMVSSKCWPLQSLSQCDHRSAAFHLKKWETWEKHHYPSPLVITIIISSSCPPIHLKK